MLSTLPDEQNAPEGTEEATGNNPANESQTDANEALKAAIRKEIEDDIVRQLVEERTDSGVYKGLQKVVSKRDNQVNELKSAVDQRDARLNELEAQLRQTVEMSNYATGVLFQNLPEAERQRVTQELNALNNQRMQSRLDALQRQIAQPPAAPAPPVQDATFEAAIEQARKEADEALRETVSEFGLDPSAKGLDYGDREDSFASRLKRLNKSMNAIRKEQETAAKDSVKPKVPVTPTRTGGGGSADAPSTQDIYGRTSLQRGSSAILERLRTELAR